MTQVEQFNYILPKELIAQRSVEPRDHSRLLVLDRKTGERKHKRFFEVVDELKRGDMLVFNDTKVFRARLKAEDIEIFLLCAHKDNIWEILVRPGQKVQVAKKLCIERGDDKLFGEVLEKKSDGIVSMRFNLSSEKVIEFANAHGEISIPPYVRSQPKKLEDYQTIYAKKTGSVAAPTAGFHFTDHLMSELKSKGVQLEFVTLHVGLGTFRPMKTKTIEEHEMHGEFVSISQQTAERINQAKKEGRRVIAVGTTTVRTLEGITSTFGILKKFDGEVNLFIKPGFDFKIIDGLITNFHLPKSTLLVLVSVFAGREKILHAYKRGNHAEISLFFIWRRDFYCLIA